MHNRNNGGKMISLDYGITYIKGIEGASYWEGQDIGVYVVVAYNKDENTIDTFMAVAASVKYAAEGITKQFNLEERGFQVVTVKSLYGMLEKLEDSLR